jgi:peptide/nickel transport system permease protein
LIDAPASTTRLGWRGGRLVAHPLARLVLRRLLALVVVVVVVVVAIFLMVQAVPGDPITQAFGTDLSAQQREQLRHQHHFDRPLFEQFTWYVGNLLHGDLGRGFVNNQAVTELIKQRVASSAELAGAAFLIVMVISLPLGLVAGAMTREGRHRKLELGFMGTSSILGSIPDYLSGTILAFFFAVQFRLLPVAGEGSVETLVLPAIAVSLAPTMILARIVRIETLNVLAQDYMRTARGERLPARLIYARHALPNVLTAALTVGGLIFAGIMGGAVIVENVFARQGLGTALVDAVIGKNYPVVQAITLLLAVTVVVVNMLVDILLAIVDPRSLARYA